MSNQANSEELVSGFPLSTEEKLSKKGIYYVTNDITSESLLGIHQDILLKHLDDSWHDDIQIIINSVGGSVAEGESLIDLLDWVRMDVRTVAMGYCASMGACIACCGTHGKRIITPSTTVMIHSASWSAHGTSKDIASISRVMEKEQKKDLDFWVKHSKYTKRKQIRKIFLHDKHDVFMTAKEALSHGIFDHLVE